MSVWAIGLTLCFFNHTQVSNIDVSADGAHLVSTGYDKTVRIWNTKTRRETACLVGHKAPVLELAWARGTNGGGLASGDRDGRMVRVYFYFMKLFILVWAISLTCSFIHSFCGTRRPVKRLASVRCPKGTSPRCVGRRGVGTRR